MTDFSSDFGADGEAGKAPAAPRFGRGWIPEARDIGIPGDPASADTASSTTEKPWQRVGDGPRISSSFSKSGDPHVPHTAWDASRKVRFLHHLSEKGDVSAACARVGMSRTSAYLLRRRDAAFAAGWEAALVLARRHVEEVLATRALDGVEEAVWFRGELVGSRRRYDTRLLLAHLARLDRVAEETADHAGRFDEALASVAGERAALDDDDDGAAGGERAGAMPLGRSAYVAEGDRAFVAANEAWLDEVEAIDGAFEAEHGFEPASEDHDRRPDVPEPVYPPRPSRSVHRSARATRWDGWQARAVSRVDAELAGEIEYKSLEGLPQDRVNRVNLSVGRQRGTDRQNEAGAGNAPAVSLLFDVKAGAALPPPPPSCAGRPFLPKIRILDEASRGV
ncbi:hypothetical protein AB3M93_01605 [Novosphingobium panipatense]|uniref:hypothetical protein n=1 Tax=Novosphingobium panipatense TaxID=428991 RepID=UPI0039A28E42